MTTSGGSTITSRAWYNNPLPAPVEVSADVYASTLLPVQVIARGSSLNSSTPTFYALSVTRNVTVEMDKVVSGVSTSLGTLTSSAYTSGVWVRATLSVSGSSLKAQVVRLDTGQYLNSSVQWQSSQAWALTVTDSAITGAGQVGFAIPASYWLTASVDDFSATVLPETFDGPTVNNLPPGWAQGSTTAGTNTFAVSSAQPFSGANGLASTVSSSLGGWAYNDTLQLSNVQASAEVFLGTLIPTQVFARGTNLTTTTPTYYAATVTRGLTLELDKVVGGVTTPLSDLLISTDWFSQKWVQVTVDVEGSLVRAQVYRPDTAQYLDSTGAWQADPAWALTATDTSIVGLGKVGLAAAARYSGTVAFDDFAVTPLPGGTLPSLLSESFDTTSPGSLPAGWSQWTSISGTFSVSTTQPLSAPNGLTFSGGASGSTARTWSDSLQAADVQVSAAIYLGTLVPIQVIARGANLGGTTPTYYAAQVVRGLQLQLVKVVNGTSTTLATLNSASWFSQAWAQVTLNVNGSTLQAQVYRADTQQYLNSLGQWQAAPAAALVVTDTSVSGPGLVGLGRVSSYADAIYFDDFTVLPAAPPAAPPSVINESFDSTSAGSLPSGWSQWSSISGDGTFSVSTTQPSSAPNSLANATTGASGTVARAWHNTFSAANALVSVSVYLDTLIPAQVIARGSNLNTSTPSFYAVQVTRNLTAQLVKVVSGTTTVLATINSPDYFSQKWAQVTLSVVGSTLQVQIYRPDTGQYLNSGGQWQASQAWAFTVTDTSITGSGQAGLGRANSYTGTIYFDDFSAVTIASDTQAPTVTITAPANGSTLSGQNAIQATASDNVGVKQVDFYLDGVFQSTDMEAPYNWTWDTTTVTNGSHTLLVKAYDAAGKIGQTSVTVTTNNDQTAPTVSITAPTNNATMSGTYTVQATASDNIEVARVEFYLDSESNPRATVLLSPYTWTVDTRTISNGAHTLKAKSIDTSGNASAVASVNVTVANNTDTQPPWVKITAPVSWAMLHDTFTVTADAGDNVSVNRVEFYLDNESTPRATDYSAPYSWDFDTLSLGTGYSYHNLVVKAIDNAGLSTPDSLPFTILNIPRHYSHIRVAELAYAGWPAPGPGTGERSLLQNSVDLVVPDTQYLDDINDPSVAPNTPQMIYTNISNIYLDLLTDWLAYADAHGYDREDAFFHVSQNTLFSDPAGGSTRPVRNFWAAYRSSGSSWTSYTGPKGLDPILTPVAFASTVSDAVYLGFPDPFREINATVMTPASGGWSGVLEYPTGVDGNGQPTGWLTLPTINNTTSGLTTSGKIEFDPPSNWKPAKVNTDTEPLYYVRFRTTAAPGGSVAPVAKLWGRDYFGAGGGRNGIVPAFDSAADTNHDGYLNDTEYNNRPDTTKTARFAYESRAFTAYGQMRFVTNPGIFPIGNPGNTHFQDWVIAHNQKLLDDNPLADGLFVDNSSGKPGLFQANLATVEGVTAQSYRASSGQLMAALSQAVAQRTTGAKWLLPNIAGSGGQNLLPGNYSEDEIIRGAHSAFSEFLIRPMAHTWQQFEDVSATVQRERGLTSPKPYIVLDSDWQGASTIDARFHLGTLAYYYLIADPNSTFLDFLGGDEPNGAWKTPHARSPSMPTFMVDHWSDAVTYDVGQPVDASWSEWTAVRRQDLANSNLQARVYQRHYTNALVLFKPISYAQGFGGGTTKDDTAWTYPLGGSYQQLLDNGTLDGTVITSISLRNGEGAILIPAGGGMAPLMAGGSDQPPSETALGDGPDTPAGFLAPAPGRSPSAAGASGTRPRSLVLVGFRLFIPPSVVDRRFPRTPSGAAFLAPEPVFTATVRRPGFKNSPAQQSQEVIELPALPQTSRASSQHSHLVTVLRDVLTDGGALRDSFSCDGLAEGSPSAVAESSDPDALTGPSG